MQIAQTWLSKPAKFAIVGAILFMLSGLLLDGEYRRLVTAGLFGLILLVGGVIAEWWRPTRRSTDTR